MLYGLGGHERVCTAPTPSLFGGRGNCHRLEKAGIHKEFTSGVLKI